jgi:hypothetical protein
LAISPSVQYFYARFGVDRIWAAHQGPDDPDSLSLDEEDIHLQVTHFGHLEICRLEPSSWTFRRALQTGATLADSVGHGLARATRFDPTIEIYRLFSDGLVVALLEQRTESRHVPRTMLSPIKKVYP